jgi:hypothetical protein
MVVEPDLSHWWRNENGGCLRTRCSEEYFGTEGEKVAGNWRKLRSEEVRGLYSSPLLLGCSNKRGLDERSM